MGDKQHPTMLVERLHVLRARSGLSTQDMAERCGIPKSSLESYMRLSNAKRPGVDALLAIANGMEASLDWLVGRSDDVSKYKLTHKDYGIACFNAVMALLIWMREVFPEYGNEFMTEENVGGREDAEIAAFCMATFLEATETYEKSTNNFGPTRTRLANALLEQPGRTETENESVSKNQWAFGAYH